MKKITIFITGIITSLNMIAQNLPITYETIVREEWAQTYSSQDSIYNSAAAVDLAGNVYVTGFTYNNQTSADYTTIKYDPSGNQLWIRTYNGPGYMRDQAIALDCDQNGNVAVTGYSWGVENNNDIVTILYSANGTQLWQNTYSNGSWDEPCGVKTDNSGNVYVAGSSYGANDYNFILVKYDISGSVLWEQSFDLGSMDYAYGMAIDAGNNIFITGLCYSSANGYEAVTVKFNQNGNLLWTSEYNTGVNSVETPKAIVCDGNGNVYFTGTTKETGSTTDFLTVKLKGNNGNVQWEKVYDGFGAGDNAVSIAVDNANGVYVTGDSKAQNIRILTTIKYKTGNGNQEWNNNYYPVQGNGNYASKVTCDGNNDVYLTGMANTGSNLDFITIKYLNDGAEKWVQAYNGTGNGADRPSDIAVDPDGNVYVVGQAYNGSNYDFATVKYSVHEVVIPPDANYEEASVNYTYYTNAGQLVNTNSQPADNIRFYTNASSPGVFITDTSLSYVFSRIDDDTNTVDTLCRVDMTFHKGNAPQPFQMGEAQGYLNYYLGHIPDGRTNIKGYSRIIYPEIYDDIDLQYYSNQKGIKYYFIADVSYLLISEPVVI